MRLPSCLMLQVMVDELVGQIEAVKAEIAKVEADIEKVIERIDSRLEGPEMLAILVEREKGLRTREADLRGEKWFLLTAKLQPPGVVPLLFVFIVHAQPASLVAASSALCTRFCLLSLALASRCRIYMLG